MRKPLKTETTKKPRAGSAVGEARPAAKPRATATKPRSAPAKPGTAAVRTKKAPGAPGFESSHDIIAARAYEIFERSGRPHGRDVEFWLEAERLVKHPRKA